MPGVYELGLDNNGLVSGSKAVVYMLSGFASMAPVLLEIQLTNTDVNDGVHFGLTALPNAAAAANGGLPTVDANNNIHGLQVGTGTGQLNSSGGKVPATLAAADISGNVASDVQTIKAQAVTCAAAVTVLASVGTAATSTAQTGDTYALANGTSGFVAIKTSVGSPQQVGTKYAVTLASTDVTGNVAADLQTIKAQTVTAAAGVTFPTEIASPTNITAGTITTVSGNVTGSVGSVIAAVVLPANPPVGFLVTASYGTAPAWYVSPGTAPTAAQIATAIWQDLLAGADFGTAGSIGALLKADIDVAISTRLASGNVTVGAYAAGQDPATLVLAALIEAGVTLQDAIRYIAGACAGVLAGAGTTSITISAVGNPGTPRIVATVDSVGNRTAVVLS